MNTYAHIVLAHKLVSHMQPENIKDYYLGAIIPDVRYIASIKRKQTHIPLEQIVAFHTQYPELDSFIKGYMVHCMIDMLDLPQYAWQKFPLSVFKKRLPNAFAPVLIEFYYLENANISVELTTTSNKMLHDLNINPNDVSTMATQLNTFLAAPSFASGLTVIRNFGLFGSGVERYLKAAHFLNRHPYIKQALFATLRMGSFTDWATQQLLRQKQLANLV